MGRYNTLTHKEDDRMVIRPSVLAQLNLMVVTLTLFLIAIASPPEGEFLIVPALILLCLIIYRQAANIFYVKNGRVESRKGIVSRHISSIALVDIRNINLKQGIAYRLLDIGTLEFSSAGGPGIEVTWWGIENPMRVKEEIEKMADSASLARTGQATTL